MIGLLIGVKGWNYISRCVAWENRVYCWLIKGEGHTIGLLENMLDQTSRVMDYFNYYLKGERPKSWILEGKKYSLEN